MLSKTRIFFSRDLSSDSIVKHYLGHVFPSLGKHANPDAELHPEIRVMMNDQPKLNAKNHLKIGLKSLQSGSHDSMTSQKPWGAIIKEGNNMCFGKILNYVCVCVFVCWSVWKACFPNQRCFFSFSNLPNTLWVGAWTHKRLPRMPLGGPNTPCSSWAVMKTLVTFHWIMVL